MTATRLIFLAGDGEPPGYMTLGLDGFVLERGRLPASGGETRDVLVVPGAETSARWLELPGGGLAQARSAAGFLLTEELAGEDPHIAVGQAEADGRRLVVVVGEQRLRGWLDEAGRFGIDPAAVVPDYLMLPVPQGDEILAAPFGPLLAVRGERLAFSVERDLAETVLEGRPFRLLGSEELEVVAPARALDPPLDLRQGLFARREPGISPRLARRAAVLGAVALLLPLVLTLAGLARDELAAQDLRRQAVSVAAEVAPGASDPLAAVEQRLAALRAADAFPALAGDLFRAVEAVPGMQMDMLVYSGDGALRTSVAYGAYADMDRLRAAARGAAIELEETSTLTEGERIASDIVARRRP